MMGRSLLFQVTVLWVIFCAQEARALQVCASEVGPWKEISRDLKLFDPLGPCLGKKYQDPDDPCKESDGKYSNGGRHDSCKDIVITCTQRPNFACAEVTKFIIRDNVIDDAGGFGLTVTFVRNSKLKALFSTTNLDLPDPIETFYEPLYQNARRDARISEALSMVHGDAIFPEAIGSWTALEELKLTHGTIEGSMPSNVFANLTRLRVLNISWTLLEGGIPPSLSSAGALEHLAIISTNIQEKISTLISVLSGMQNLKSIDIANSKFDGAFPASMEDFPKLETLRVSLSSDDRSPEHQITGRLPGMASLSQLRLIDLSGNAFSGSLPQACCLPPNLEYLYLGRNKYDTEEESNMGLTGKFYTEWPLPQFLHLRALSIPNNRIGGNLNALSQLDERNVIIDVMGNVIGGKVPIACYDGEEGRETTCCLSQQRDDKLLTCNPDASNLQASIIQKESGACGGKKMLSSCSCHRDQTDVSNCVNKDGMCSATSTVCSDLLFNKGKREVSFFPLCSQSNVNASKDIAITHFSLACDPSKAPDTSSSELKIIYPFEAHFIEPNFDIAFLFYCSSQQVSVVGSFTDESESCALPTVSHSLTCENTTNGECDIYIKFDTSSNQSQWEAGFLQKGAIVFGEKLLMNYTHVKAYPASVGQRRIKLSATPDPTTEPKVDCGSRRSLRSWKRFLEGDNSTAVPTTAPTPSPLCNCSSGQSFYYNSVCTQVISKSDITRAPTPFPTDSPTPGSSAGKIVGITLCLLGAALAIFLRFRYQMWKTEAKESGEQGADISFSSFLGSMTLKSTSSPQKAESSPSKLNVELTNLVPGTPTEFYIDPADIELGTLLGSGANGRIFEATYAGSLVAVKELFSVMKNQSRRRGTGSRSGSGPFESGSSSGLHPDEFTREFNNLRLLRHPHVILLYGATVVASDDIKGASRYLLITELADCSLADMILSDKDISKEECARMGSEVASGMAYIHSNSMIHFDLKPANVLLDASNRCKICDLGIAKVMHSDKSLQTTGATARGTPMYMSPELLIGEDANEITNKVDVYAFGIMMWELLYQVKPYPSDWSLLKLFQKVDSGFRPPFSDDVKNGSPVLTNLIKKCWDKDPDVRPSFKVILEQLVKLLPARTSRRQHSSRRNLSFRSLRADSDSNSIVSTASTSFDDLDVQLNVVTADATLRGFALENMKRRLRERKLAMISTANKDIIAADSMQGGDSPKNNRPPSLRLSLRLIAGDDNGKDGSGSAGFDPFSRPRSKISFDGSVLESEGFRIGQKGIAQTPGVRLLRIRTTTSREESSRRLGSKESFRRSLRKSTSFGSVGRGRRNSSPMSKSSSTSGGSFSRKSGTFDRLQHDGQFDESSLLQVGVLGAGQCGEVIKAVHTSTMQIVAAKRVPIYAQDRINQVVRELRVLRGNLRSLSDQKLDTEGSNGKSSRSKKYACKYIVRLFGAFVAKGDSHLTLVMEYMDGGSLQDVIDFSNGIGCENDITIAVVAHDLLSALAFMHGNNLCHRDVKPANILLRASDGRVKLGDFGIVKELSGVDDHSSTFVGTMVYMSPERLLGKPYSFSCDIWSAGLSLLALVLGKYPFPQEASGSFWELLNHIKEKADLGESFMPPLDDTWKCSKKLHRFLSSSLLAVSEDRPSAQDMLKNRFVTKNFRKYTEAFGSSFNSPPLKGLGQSPGLSSRKKIRHPSDLGKLKSLARQVSGKSSNNDMDGEPRSKKRAASNLSSMSESSSTSLLTEAARRQELKDIVSVVVSHWYAVRSPIRNEKGEAVATEESIEVPERCIKSLGEQLDLSEETVKEEFEEQLRIRAVDSLPLDFIEDCIGSER